MDDDSRARMVARAKRQEEIRSLPAEQRVQYIGGKLATYALFVRNVMKLDLTDEQIDTLLAFEPDTIKPLTTPPLITEGERDGEYEITKFVNDERQKKG